jgi:1-acyl-sn-glycerol-3-phosphate acyltransferase
MHSTSTAAPAAPSVLRTLGATLTGNLYLLVGTVFFSLLTIAVSVLPPRGTWTYRVARLWARCLLWSSWIPLRRERPGAPRGESRALPPAGSFVFLVNHQSLFDIPALLAAIPTPSRFLAKRSLFQIPIFGWAMRLAGFVPVDRKDRSTARDSFSSALGGLRGGASVLIFPEETRSLDGAVLPFQRGGILLAMKSGLAAVPVGLEGTLAVQSRRSFLIRPREVVVRFGEPVALGERSIRELGAIAEEMRRQVADLAGMPLASPETAGTGRRARKEP